jgi:histidine triad (HIT) family protein
VTWKPPDEEDRRAHLAMIQQVINRMASSSASAKGWLLPVTAATYGYAFEKHSTMVAVVGLVAVLVFAFLDANYLNQEKAYRTLHRAVARGEMLPPFSMRLSDIGKSTDDGSYDERRWGSWWPNWRVWLSWSIAPFYGVLALLGTLGIWWGTRA